MEGWAGLEGCFWRGPESWETAHRPTGPQALLPSQAGVQDPDAETQSPSPWKGQQEGMQGPREGGGWEFPLPAPHS